jgi:hypothetical protein
MKQHGNSTKGASMGVEGPGPGSEHPVLAKLELLQRRLEVLEARTSDPLAYGQANYRLQLAQSAAAERALLLHGQIAARGLPDTLQTLAEAEFRVSSQWGEDGILEWPVRHAPLPNTRFIEFGVETFQETNCRF